MILIWEIDMCFPCNNEEFFAWGKKKKKAQGVTVPKTFKKITTSGWW